MSNIIDFETMSKRINTHTAHYRHHAQRNNCDEYFDKSVKQTLKAIRARRQQRQAERNSHHDIDD